MVRCRARAVAAGCRLAVTNPQPIVYKALGITEMLEALAVAPVPARRGERARPPAAERVRTAGLGASAGGTERGLRVPATAAGADQLDADTADTRACRGWPVTSGRPPGRRGNGPRP